MNPLKAILTDIIYSFRSPVVRAGLLVFIILIATMIGVVSIHYWPVLQHHNELEQHAQMMRKSLVNLRAQQQLTETYHKTKTALSWIEKKRATQMTQAELIDQIGQLAKAKNVTIVNESYEAGGPNKKVEILNLNLTLQGSYQAIRGFIAGIKQLSAWVYTEELNMQRSRQGNHRVNAKLLLIAFTRFNPKPAQQRQ